jgi:MoaA/NifB/PqqE/SkfB family radical SAM enzyme
MGAEDMTAFNEENKIPLISSPIFCDFNEFSGVQNLDLEVGSACNFNCLYCYSNSNIHRDSELSVKEMMNIIIKSKEMGIKTITFIGGGEPLMHKNLLDLLCFTKTHGLQIGLFTNCSLLTKSIVNELYRLDACIIGKLNSMIPQKEDFLCGVNNAFYKIHKGIDLLLNAGFSDKKLLSLHTLINKTNYNECINIYIWERQNNIIPYMQIPVFNGRFKDNSSLICSMEEYKNLFKKLKKIDSDLFGYEWLDVPPNVGWPCKQRFTSIYITSTGNIQMCNSNSMILGNIRDNDLSDVLNSDYLSKLKNIDTDCIHYLRDCFGGCMGNNFCTGRSINSCDYRCWNYKKKDS